MPENQTMLNNRELLKKNMEDKKMNMKRLYDLKKCTDKAVIGIHYRLTGAIGVAASAFLNPVAVLADENKKENSTFGFLTDSTKSNSSIDNVATQMEGLGASVYRLMFVLGAFCTVLSIICTGICITMNKNAAKRDESKSHLLWIAVGATLIFGAITIAGGIETFSNSLSLTGAAKAAAVK